MGLTSLAVYAPSKPDQNSIKTVRDDSHQAKTFALIGRSYDLCVSAPIEIDIRESEGAA